MALIRFVLRYVQVINNLFWNPAHLMKALNGFELYSNIDKIIFVNVCLTKLKKIFPKFFFVYLVNINENNKEVIDKTHFSVSLAESKTKSNENSFEISPAEHFVKSTQQEQCLDVDKDAHCYIQSKNQCVKTKIHSLQNSKRAQSLPPVDREKSNRISSRIDQCNNSAKTNLIVNNDRKSNKFFSGMFSQKNRITNSTSMNSNDINYQCPQCQIVNGRLIALRHDKIALEDEVKVR